MIKKLEHNYHTHTVYCRHASNTAEEMVIEAIKNGYKTLGFSEHAPLKVHRNFRLNLDNVEEYIHEIKTLKTKYKNKIDVFCGFEAEYHKSQFKFYQSLKKLKDVDYVILGNHNMGNPHLCIEWNSGEFNSNIKKYVQQTKDACESGIFSAIAHPDYIFRYCKKWDKKCDKESKEIIQAAIAADIPLGININGLFMKTSDYDYPCEKFWKLVSETNAKVIIEVDAHVDWILREDSTKKGIEFVKQIGLQNNIVEKMSFK